MENVVMVLFDVESEAYQALSELRRSPVNAVYTILQIGLVKKQNSRILPCDGFDTGVDTENDTVKGSLIGGLVGILGGPLGVLFAGSIGAIIGSIKDSDDAEKDLSIIERVSGKMLDNQVALVALIQEDDESVFDRCFIKFKCEILRWDAAVIAAEVEEAEKIEKEMRKEAKEKMRMEKRDEHKKNMDEKRAKIHADFEVFKKKLQK